MTTFRRRPDRVQRWYDAILRAKNIHDAARVLAIALADDMDGRGHVVIDRDRLGERLGLYRARVDERLRDLRASGWLERVSAPAPNKPAVWAAVIPVRERAPVEPVRVESIERAPVEPVHVQSALPVHVDQQRAPVQAVHVDPTNPSTSDTTCTGPAGARPSKTPDQDDRVAAGARHLRSACARQTNEHGGRPPSRPQQGVPASDRSSAGRKARSPGRGPDTLDEIA